MTDSPFFPPLTVFCILSLTGSWRYRKGRLGSGLFPRLRGRTEIHQQEKLGRGRQVVPPRKSGVDPTVQREKVGVERPGWGEEGQGLCPPAFLIR